MTLNFNPHNRKISLILQCRLVIIATCRAPLPIPNREVKNVNADGTLKKEE